MFAIDRDKVCWIVLHARAFDAKVDMADQASGSNPTDDNMIEVLVDRPDDLTGQELSDFIDGLNEDEQVELIALTWLGRGSFSVEEWPEAMRQARERRTERTAEYLLGIPMLSDYLLEGLAAFGHSCDE